MPALLNGTIRDTYPHLDYSQECTVQPGLCIPYVSEYNRTLNTIISDVINNLLSLFDTID